MLMRTWTWWAGLYGLPRAYILLQARRGEPLAQYIIAAENNRDTDTFIEEIRDRGPLVRGRNLSVTVDHAVATGVLRDRRFSAMVPARDARARPIQWLIDRSDPGLPNPIAAPSMLRVDPPDHTRYRKLVTKHFNVGAIEQLHTHITDETGRLLDALTALPRPDLMTDFSAVLPVAVIATVLGAPDELRTRLSDWGVGAAALLDLCPSWPAFRTAVNTLTEGMTYFDGHIRSLREQPSRSILGELVTDGGLDSRELLTNTALLLGAGSETTVNLLGNGIVALQRHPEQLARLRAEPNLWANAIEEILRYDSPVQVTARMATADVTVEGQDIPKGTVVLILLGGANHDPGVFADPYVFDIARSNAKAHLSFGNGIHTCLGASLARVEGAVALRSLYERFEDIKIETTPQRRPTVNIHGFRSLPATLVKSQHAV